MATGSSKYYLVGTTNLYTIKSPEDDVNGGTDQIISFVLLIIHLLVFEFVSFFFVFFITVSQSRCSTHFFCHSIFIAIDTCIYKVHSFILYLLHIKFQFNRLASDIST